MGLYTEGEKNTPNDDTVLADSGARESEGDCDVLLYVSAAVSAKVKLQRRNAANDATIFEQSFWLGALSSPAIAPMRVHCAESERVRVVSDGTILGKLQATLDVR